MIRINWQPITNKPPEETPLVLYVSIRPQLPPDERKHYRHWITFGRYDRGRDLYLMLIDPNFPEADVTHWALMTTINKPMGYT